ncbi:MAG TPA: galactokinase [Flavisolibacter sp.]
MENNALIDNILAVYHQKFGSEPMVVRSPGRVNIIGEHTDYNEGFVLPAAIDKAIYIAIGKREDLQIQLYSQEFKEEHEVKISELEKSTLQWANYILGVVDQLLKRGHAVKGFNLVVDGNVPIGAGLSSSAAVECATAFALNELFGFDIPRMELVKIAQKAEHEYAGVMCGIMDQFASAFGKKNHVIKLDCRSLDYEYVPLNLEGYKILLLNTNVKHSLASTEYNTRRKECEAGVALIRKHHPEVNSLRDATMEMVHTRVAPVDDVIFRRCKFIVEENIRLQTGCEDLKAGNLQSLGRKMFETHQGLSKEYEVSCKELDFLVDAVRDNEDVLGARMMGGGFGGCTINLVRESAIEELVERIARSYKDEMQLDLTYYVAQIEDGTSIVYPTPS